MGSCPARQASQVVVANADAPCSTTAYEETSTAARDDPGNLTGVQGVLVHDPRSVACTSLRLQFTSDLHLEFLGADPDAAVLHSQLPEPAAPNLALLGDIGDPFSELYHRTLALLATKWNTVIVLAGNHEYYQASGKKTMSEVNVQIAAVCIAFSNVHFLNDGELWLDGVRLLGTTLWSGLPEASHERIAANMNDFRKIFVQDKNENVRPVTPQELHNVHTSSKAWLHSALSADNGGKLAESRSRTVVLSHHAPSRGMLGGKCNACSPLAHSFFTDLEELMPNVVAWLSGHVHHCTSQHIGMHSTLCACNAVGYPNARRLPPGSDDPRFSKRAVLVVPPSGPAQLERPVAVNCCLGDDYMAECQGDDYMAEFLEDN